MRHTAPASAPGPSSPPPGGREPEANLTGPPRNPWRGGTPSSSPPQSRPERDQRDGVGAQHREHDAGPLRALPGEPGQPAPERAAQVVRENTPMKAKNSPLPATVAASSA